MKPLKIAIKSKFAFPLTLEACKIVEQTSQRPYPKEIGAAKLFQGAIKVSSSTLRLDAPKLTGDNLKLDIQKGKKTCLAFSGGKDCVAAAILLMEEGIMPELYFIDGVNRSYSDEKAAAQECAKTLGLNLNILEVKISGKSVDKENPFKNIIILCMMMEHASQTGGVLELAMGNHTGDSAETIDNASIGDTHEFIYAFSEQIEKLYGVKVSDPLLDSSMEAWSIIQKSKPEMIDMVSSCIIPPYRRVRLTKISQSKFKSPMGNNSCGSCYKCSDKYLTLLSLGHYEGGSYAVKAADVLAKFESRRAGEQYTRKRAIEEWYSTEIQKIGGDYSIIEKFALQQNKKQPRSAITMSELKPIQSPLEWRTEKRKVRDLVPHSENPRTLNARQKDVLAESLKRFNLVEIPAINSNNRILAGHQRLMVMQALGRGDEMVDVRVPNRLLDADEEKEYLIRSNQNTGDWDYDMLLKRFDPSDLMAWGFDEKEIFFDKDEKSSIKPERERELIFNRNTILSEAFKYFRKEGFPYTKLTVHEMMQEINDLAGIPVEELLNSRTAMDVADVFQPHRFAAAVDGMRNPLESFKRDDLLTLALRMEYEKNLSLGLSLSCINIVRATQACANFRPAFARYLIESYGQGAEDVVLDTSTGYGGRLVGFIASKRSHYIGIDPNTQTYHGNLSLLNALGLSAKATLINLPAEDVKPSEIKKRAHVAVTSPPYFRKEHYSEDNTQSWKRYDTAEKWQAGFLEPMFKLQHKILHGGCLSVVNIADINIKKKKVPLVDMAVEAGKKAGFKLKGINKYRIGSRVGTIGEDGEQMPAEEPVLVFEK